jgi:hypothetical protein
MNNINSLIKRTVFRNAWLPVWFFTAQAIPLAVKCILLFGWVNNLPPVYFARGNRPAALVYLLAQYVAVPACEAGAAFFMAIEMDSGRFYDILIS